MPTRQAWRCARRGFQFHRDPRALRLCFASAIAELRAVCCDPFASPITVQPANGRLHPSDISRYVPNGRTSSRPLHLGLLATERAHTQPFPLMWRWPAATQSTPHATYTALFIRAAPSLERTCSDIARHRVLMHGARRMCTNSDALGACLFIH